MTTLEHLQAAARLLVEKGWCQGSTMDANGRHCVIGLIIFADTTAVMSPVEGALVRVLRKPLVPWNDTPGRTKDEVLELFNYAIALEAGKVAA